MRHRPHIHVAGPWDREAIAVPDATRRHITKVLRVEHGSPVSYTDGMGAIGDGSWIDGTIERGSERQVARPSMLTVAVAVPKHKDRQRFVVEKAQELGVARLVWLKTDHSEGRMPPAPRAGQWAVAALEQSRGAWQMEVEGSVDVADLPDKVVGCDGSGAAIGAISGIERAPDIVAIGPEGGWSDRELAGFDSVVSLGSTVLRVETAVVVAATVFQHAG